MVVNKPLFSHTDYNLDQSDRQGERYEISIGRLAGDGEGEVSPGGAVDILLQADEIPRGVDEEEVKGTHTGTPNNSACVAQSILL
jgi:hypothetical protein